MTALGRKLRSRRGASMLLALLFLLICVMVSASILMAAASNAGKHRSNLTEHQTYLVLSSAVSLLCDELNRSQYQGQYEYSTYTYDVEDSEGNVYTVTERYLDQLDGLYTHTGTDEAGYLAQVLLDNFNYLFAADIKKSDAVKGFNRVTTLDTTPVSTTHILTVTPNTGTALDDRPVTVKLEVQDSYAMYLTATLDGMELRAELTPTESKPALPPTLSEEKIYTTDPMKWKIGWITTGGEEEGP